MKLGQLCTASLSLMNFAHDQGENEAAQAKSHLLPLGMTKFA